MFFRSRAQYSKRTKQWHPVQILEPKKYAYIPDLIQNVFEKKLQVGSVDTLITQAEGDTRRISSNIASVPRTSIESLMMVNKSRF